MSGENHVFPKTFQTHPFFNYGELTLKEIMYWKKEENYLKEMENFVSHSENVMFICFYIELMVGQRQQLNYRVDALWKKKIFHHLVWLTRDWLVFGCNVSWLKLFITWLNIIISWIFWNIKFYFEKLNIQILSYCIII